MGRKRTRNNVEEKLSKRIVRQMLRGFKETNKFTAAERRAWLERITVEEARRVFDELHQDADRWKESGGDLAALERHRIASKLKGRRLFVQAARRQGLL